MKKPDQLETSSEDVPKTPEQEEFEKGLESIRNLDDQPETVESVQAELEERKSKLAEAVLKLAEEIGFEGGLDASERDNPDKVLFSLLDNAIFHQEVLQAGKNSIINEMVAKRNEISRDHDKAIRSALIKETKDI